MIGDASLWTPAHQLERLRALRQEQARRALARAEREHDRALAVAQARRAELQARRIDRTELLARCTAQAGWIARCAATTGARLEHLDEAIERAEVALGEDDDALHAAREQLDEARAAWCHAQARHEAAGQWLGCARRERRRAGERRQERDDPEPVQPLNALRGALP